MAIGDADDTRALQIPTPRRHTDTITQYVVSSQSRVRRKGKIIRPREFPTGNWNLTPRHSLATIGHRQRPHWPRELHRYVARGTAPMPSDPERATCASGDDSQSASEGIRDDDDDDNVPNMVDAYVRSETLSDVNVT